MRVHDEPAYVLHQHDWSESSLILELFTRHHGRVVLVGKGVKRPTSQFRAVLLPLVPLRVDWSGEAEVRSLKAAQYAGGHVMPAGDALLAGYYLNELVLRLMARDDPHPALFDPYAAAVQALAQGDDVSVTLRAFELLLLRQLGWLPDLALEGLRLLPLDATQAYRLLPQAGLQPSGPDDVGALTGAHWQAVQAALDAPDPWLALRGLAPTLGMAALRIGLASLLHYHSGVRSFRTRELMRAMRRIGPRPIPPLNGSSS
ncbi:MAG: DNA repair protein RecO [Tepidimonas sp.]|uniref:DNA repair protein RecO n=1 Tax=Tepidimonas sp. TaxID=2002775 RepID=UPI00259D3CEB|nr:DNA repair protein RecO [Tepidimonas sp.]MDM7455988.1 DNA repair protein RecO [Tepidimonas sp.]